MHMEFREEESQVDEDQASDDGHVPGVTGQVVSQAVQAGRRHEDQSQKGRHTDPIAYVPAGRRAMRSSPPHPRAHTSERGSAPPVRIERGLPQAPGRMQVTRLATPQHGRSQASHQNRSHSHSDPPARLGNRRRPTAAEMRVLAAAVAHLGRR